MDISQKQIDALNKSNSRLNVFEGAVRSGKSFISCPRFLKELSSGPEGEYCVVGVSEGTILRNIINPLNKFTGNKIRYKFGEGTFTLFGRKVYCIGAHDQRSIGKIQGATFAGALVDEATLIPENFFKMLLSRLSIPNAKLFLTCNPDSPFHWLKKDFIDRADELDISIFKFNLDDNPSLTATYKDNLRKEYKGLWYKRFIMGEWVLAEGSIFDFFDTNLHVVKHPTTYAKQYYLGIDYGTANPFAAVLIGYNDDISPALWVEREYYFDSKAMGYQKTDSEYYKDLEKEIYSCYPITITILDPSAESFQVELKRNKRPVKQANNAVLDGIRTLSNYLSNGDLVICNNCPNLISEIQSYVWDSRQAKDGLDRPIKQRDHAIDALRYVIHTQFGELLTLKKMTRQESYQRQQEKLYSANPLAYPGYTNSYGWQTPNMPSSF